VIELSQSIEALGDVERVERIAHMYLEQCKNMREVAEMLGVSLFVVYKALRKELPGIDADLHARVVAKIDQNTRRAPARGGEATKGVSKRPHRKRQPLRSYSDRFKERVMRRVEEIGLRPAAREFNLPKSTIERWFTPWKERPDEYDLQRLR
jgi:transposase-like protein